MREALSRFSAGIPGPFDGVNGIGQHEVLPSESGLNLEEQIVGHFFLFARQCITSDPDDL